MKKTLKILGIIFGGFLLLCVAVGLFYHPEPSLSLTNPKDGAELTQGHILVEGTYTGYTGYKGKILVNGVEANRDTGKKTFSKDIKLNDGDNQIKVEYIDTDKPVSPQQLTVNFDLEGMLYLEKEKELSRVPKYEVVRKETTEGGYTAIVYADLAGDDPDYVISNLVKEARDKSEGDKTVISLLIFSSQVKTNVEQAMENTDQKVGLEVISQNIIAGYDKRDNKETLYRYPKGLTGDKIALGLGY